MNSIRIIKNRSDIGAGTRGSDMGIDAIEIAAINKGNDYFNRLNHVDVETENHAIYEKSTSVFAKRIGNVLSVCERLSSIVETCMKDRCFPLVISGDHSSAIGTISGIKKANPNKRLGVVWIDAHADIHSPYTSPSGNIHGMPLAAALGEDNTEEQRNQIKDEVSRTWESLKNLGGVSPKILHSDVVYFGVRDTEEPENKLIEKHGIKNYSVEEIRSRGMKICVNEALSKLKECDMIYISFDVDSMDCDLVSKGTGFPVPDGFKPSEIMEIINSMVESEKAICFELAEVNPLLDEKGNRMAEVAFDILNEATRKIESVNGNLPCPKNF